jgi:hypothetical protein
MRVTLDRFAPTAPEVTEGCVRSIGWRRLLRFNFAAINIGTGAFHVGRPDENDPIHWQHFTAHGHFHVRGWGDYALRTLAGAEAVRGRKQSFCLEDNIREEGGDPSQRRYAPPLCELFSAEQPYEERAEFGLSPLWGDEYPSDVPCQWLDIGPESASAGADHVPDGIYNLAVAIARAASRMVSRPTSEAAAAAKACWWQSASPSSQMASHGWIDGTTWETSPMSVLPLPTRSSVSRGWRPRAVRCCPKHPREGPVGAHVFVPAAGGNLTSTPHGQRRGRARSARRWPAPAPAPPRSAPAR